MSTVEDRLRAATQAAAATVPDDSAPPLDLSGPSPRRLAGRRRQRRRITWLAPLAAATAVACVAAGLIIASRDTGPGLAQPSPILPSELPPYVLVLPSSEQVPQGITPQEPIHGSAKVAIVSTATGKTAATATLPGYVEAIAADREGRFYAAVLVREGHGVRFYEFRRPGHGTVAHVTALPIPQTRAYIDVLAASPDGSQLAMLPRNNSGLGLRDLVVASTTAGSQRRWTAPRSAAKGTINYLAWLADNHTLAFGWWPSADIPTGAAAMRLLDTTARGTNLLASRSILSLVNSAGRFPAFAVSGNARVLVGGTGIFGATGTVQGRSVTLGSVISFTLPHARASFLYRPSSHPGRAAVGSCLMPQWISTSGQQVVVPCAPPTRGPVRLVLIQRGRATVLPQLTRLMKAQDVLAFGG